MTLEPGSWLSDVWAAQAEKDKASYLWFLRAMGVSEEKIEKLKKVSAFDLMGSGGDDDE